MNTLDTGKLIRGLVDSLIGNWKYSGSRKAKGIVVNFEYSANCYGYEKDGNTYHEEWRRSARAFVSVLVTENHKAFVRVSEDYLNTKDRESIEGWKNVGNHDSCWIDSIESYLHDIEFKLADYVSENVPKEHKKNLSEYISSSGILFGKMVEFAEVEYETDKEKDPGSSYWLKLTSFKKIANLEN